MHAFNVLGDPVRRRIVELLADGELSSGALTSVIGDEFGISQPGVSQHLRVLRESGVATARREGARRLYVVQPQPLQEVDQWLERFRSAWRPHLDALSTELARGRREQRLDEVAATNVNGDERSDHDRLNGPIMSDEQSDPSEMKE